MNDAEKLQYKMNALGDALDRLQEAADASPDDHDLYIDATIKRFEFCFELFWKTLKKLLFKEGIETTSPRDTLSKAYSNNLIKDENQWLNMMKDRNRSSHIYDHDAAQQIYDAIKKYLPIMQQTYQSIKKDD